MQRRIVGFDGGQPTPLQARILRHSFLLLPSHRNPCSAYQWNRVATDTTLTDGQLCKTDGTNIVCDSTTPTIVSGMVGIGTTRPLQPLDVNGFIAADGSSAITSAPPTVGTNGGWKIGLYGAQYDIGVASNSMILKANPWISSIDGIPSNNATSTIPDTGATISFNSLNGNGLFSGLIGIGSVSPASSLDISQKTDAVSLPVGTTGTRPTGVNGMIRYNSALPGLEAYVNGVWSTVQSSGTTSGVLGVLGVANGGTGDSTLTAHGVVVGEGTSAAAVTAAGAVNTMFVGNGASADPTFTGAPTLSGTITDLQSIGAVSTDAGYLTAESIKPDVPAFPRRVS
jgi:hypothetical protein